MQKKQTRLKILAAACLLAGVHASSFAVDSVSFELGTGNKSQLARAAVQWDWNTALWQGSSMQLGGYWDLSLAEFRQNQYQNIPGQKKNLTDIGFTPVFRFQSNDKKGLYGEAGIGVHLMSHLYDNNSRRFSTAFEFGDHLGTGYVFGNGLDVGIKLQHFSNGGIKKPNSGANFAVLRVAYPF
ncbi:MAG: acyloxyacyl hydrolase [Collimonas sp.]